MSQPTPYNKATNFRQYAENNTAAPYNPSALDSELNNIETSLDEVIDNIGLLQRDDGLLRNGLVTIESLNEAVISIIGSEGWLPKGIWASGTNYDFQDVVEYGTQTFVCTTSHNASASFLTDKDLGRWIALTSLTDAADYIAIAQTAQTAAEAAQAAAETAQSGAQTSETNAETAQSAAEAAQAAAAASESAAGTSETNAAASAAAAATSEANAATSESNASTSETNAAASAAAAAASAAVLADGNKGDITVSGSGASWLLNAESVDEAEIAAALLAKLKGVGEMFAWPHGSTPSYALVCDGSAISRATYSELFAVIGTTWGAGDGSTTFNLPTINAGEVPVQASGGNEGSSTLGQLMNHTHIYSYWNAGLTGLGYGEGGSDSNYQNKSTGGVTGSGTSNLSAGGYVRWCIRFE